MHRFSSHDSFVVTGHGSGGALVRLRLPRTSIATLALGIGLSTAVLTVAEGLLIRPLPVSREDRLAVMWGETPDGKFANVPLTLPELQQFEQRTRSIKRIAYHTFRGATPAPFRSGDRVLQLRIALVSGNYFDVLGARAALGSGFGPSDDVRGVAPMLVLSHRAWRERFASDSTVIGTPITLATSGRSYRIAGVMPPGLDYPRGTEIWVPLTAYGVAEGSYELASNELDLVARLADGATHAQARAELTSFFSTLPTSGWRQDTRGVVHGFRDIILGDTRPAMRVVLIAAALLLVIACINVANLQIVRSLGRVRELVVRAALGATRARIVRHQLHESLWVSILGGIGGVLVAALLVRLFVAFAPAGLPGIDVISLNGRVLAGAIVLSALTMLASGLAPALFALRVDPGDVLRSGTRHSQSRRVRILGEILVGTQVALAVVALSSAGLVARSLVNLYRADMAFDPSQLVVMELAIRHDRFPDRERQAELVSRLVSRLEAIPGTRGVTPVLSIPFIGGGGGIDGQMSAPGQSAEERARNPVVNMEVVAPSYFGVLGIPVLRGRGFTADDREGAPRVVVISAELARVFWPGGEAVGQRLGGEGQFTVVGVVPETRYRDLKVARPTVYFPLSQPFFPMTPTTIVARIGDPSQAGANLLREVVAEVDTDVTVSSVTTLDELVEGPRAQPRLHSMVLVAFASAALALAAVGLFSLMATMVRRRTQELGIRLALGARSEDVRRMLVRRGLLIATGGIVAGLAASRLVSHLTSGLLFDVAANDALTSLGVVAVVLGVALVASVIPARVGARLDPVNALRVDG